MALMRVYSLYIHIQINNSYIGAARRIVWWNIQVF